MGGTNSRGRAFAAMHDEQPLTPTTPRREVTAQPWTLPPDSVNHSSSEDSSGNQTHSSVFDGSLNATATDVKIPVESPVERDQCISENGNLTDNSEHLVDITPFQTKLKLDGKSVAASEGQVKKKKLTSLLRSLSATAASSSARMSTKSSGDRSLMVEMPAEHNEMVEEGTEVKLNEANETRSSIVQRVYTSVISSTPASSKYSPMSDD